MVVEFVKAVNRPGVAATRTGPDVMHAFVPRTGSALGRKLCRAALLLALASLVLTASSLPLKAQTNLPNSSTPLSLQDFATGNPFVVQPGVVIDTRLDTAADAITGDDSAAWTLTNNGSVLSARDAIVLGNQPSTVVNSGTISASGAAVRTGSANDSMTMLGGTITGTIDQGDGLDSFTMHAGTINGNVDQGGGLDTAIISGGVISGGMIDGDFVTITGGKVGFISLNIANNVVTMSDGEVVGDVTASFQNDTLNLSGGVIGGNVNFGNGNNIGNVSGGRIVGSFITGSGRDRFNWSGGRIGGLDLGANNDIARFHDLTAANLPSGIVIDGGPGSDHLTWDNVTVSNAARFRNWEQIDLTNASEFTLATPLTLGDAGTGTGALSIDATSTVLAGQGHRVIAPFTAGRLVTVENAGTIDLTNGGESTADSLTVIGNYHGHIGRLLLQTVLAGDGAPSDKLVISSGTASGSTNIGITNIGGQGALTRGNGILVVEAVNGGTTAPGAFSLADRAAAGAYEYSLFRGGVTGSEQNWYLRSSEIASPVTPPGTPIVQTPDGAVVPLYREEVTLHSVLPATARQIGLTTLDTFHDRQGDQALLRASGKRPASWARVFGANNDQSWDGTVLPTSKGDIWGVQTGQDVLGMTRPDGSADRLGLFYAYTRATADMRGFAVGRLHAPAGSIGVDANSLGGYWTHIGASGWYLDSVLMHTWLNGDTASVRGVATDEGGTALTGSLEAGYPIPVGAKWAIEPQAQIIWQPVWLDDVRDPYSRISYADSDGVTGRLGARLTGAFKAGETQLVPYLKANLWHAFNGTDTARFETTPIVLEREATALEIGGGIAAQLTNFVSIYGAASYTTEIDDFRQEGISGNVGLRLTW